MAQASLIVRYFVAYLALRVGWRSSIVLTSLRVTFLLLACVCTAHTGAADLGVLAPLLQNGEPLLKPDPDGQPVPVVTQLHEGELYSRLQKEAADGFTGTILALDETAQRMAGAAPPRPTWLYLSVEDGGYARRGFWLSEGATQRYVPELFVDLIVDFGMRGFVAELESARAALSRLHGLVAESPRRLRAGLGPDLWMLGSKPGAPPGAVAKPSINLNTAELEGLLLLPGFDITTAQRALDSRDRDGAFHGLADFIARVGLGPETAKALADSARAVQLEGTYFRR